MTLPQKIALPTPNRTARRLKSGSADVIEPVSLKNRIRRAALTRAVTFGTKRLIVFLTPGYDLRAGGVLAIFAMKRETVALRQLHRARVTICAVPGDDPRFLKYTWFDNHDYLLDLEDVLKSCGRLDYLQLHIPDAHVNRVLDWLTDAASTLLRNIRDLHLNVLLFNIDNIRGQNVRELLSFGRATCTTAHEAYSNDATRQAMGVPLHRLSVCSGPENYSVSGYEEKEPLLIVSSDGHLLKGEVLKEIARVCPELRIQVIENLQYEDYMKLVRRAKWSLTFGEGLDAYFAEPVFSGGVSFAVFNGRYFTPGFRELETIYPSWEVLMERMPLDLQRLNAPAAYQKCWRQAYDLLSGLYSVDRFRQNLRMFYRGEYTFP
ncbi:MAG: hypothetical protein ACR2MF_02635 [Chthoniobacterales bacterium]